MAKDPFSGPDAVFRNKANTFNAIVSASAAVLGVLPAQATQLNTLFTEFDTAYNVAIEPATRTKAAVATKNTTRDSLRDFMRVLARIIQANPAVSDAQKIELGLNPHDVTPSPIHAPTEAPVMEVVSTVNRTVKIRLHAADSTRRGKPDGCAAAEVYSFIGPVPPADEREWTKEGDSTRTLFEIEFPPSVPAGSQVWLCSIWKSPRMQPGPASTPINVYLGGGMSAAA